MCGINAIYAYHYAAPDVDRDEVRRVRDRMAARGPDGSGEWYSEDGRVALGHRRLSIIDLSEAGAQPMRSADGRLVVTFNGEIYNYRELRRDLERDGCEFRSHSDTEVLLELYAREGEAMVDRLRGMFAFAIWDAPRETLVLARDPYGIKPLYYADDGWTVRVASQVKALLASGRVSRAEEPAGVAGFFLFGSVPEPYTLFREIRAVPAGAVVRVDRLGAGEPRSYFSIARTFRDAVRAPERLGAEALASRVRDALADSVRHHLVADVPVGAFLSSGVDSGSLVGLARDAGAEDLQTVTLTFEEYRGEARDEAPLAEAVARQYATRHATRVLTGVEFRAELPKLLDAMDQPSVDGTNVYVVSRAAAEMGLKVAISGLGGDELFGGYSSFRTIPRTVRAAWLPSHVPGLGPLTRAAALAVLPSRATPKAAGAVELGGTYAGAYFLKRGLFMPWELDALVGRDLARAGLERLAPLEYLASALRPDPGTPFARVATLEASCYMRNQLLRDADWAGMAHSLEIRVPLVDAALLRALAPALVGAEGALDGKDLMARAPSAPLPDAVRRRPKTGFVVPIGAWLDSDPRLASWREVPMLAHPGGHWSRRWAYALFAAAHER
jgi:asparagine synthase (glutamine-hydrolysing)